MPRMHKLLTRIKVISVRCMYVCVCVFIMVFYNLDFPSKREYQANYSINKNLEMIHSFFSS